MTTLFSYLHLEFFAIADFVLFLRTQECLVAFRTIYREAEMSSEYNQINNEISSE